MIIDDDGTRIFTRRGLDWTSEYRDLAKAAGELDVEDAIIDGEVIVTNEAGSPHCARQSPAGSTTFTSSPSIYCTLTATTSTTCR
nr:hypothetical protein [Mesorhizobium sangaii]